MPVLADAHAFRIEAQGVPVVVGEVRRVADEVLVAFVAEETRVEQHGLDVGEGRPDVDRHVQEVEAIPVRHVGQAVERAAVRHREEDVVMAREGQPRAEAAERRLIDAVLGIGLSTDLLSGKAGLVEVVARDQTLPDERDAGIRGGEGENGSADQNRRQGGGSPTMLHSLLRDARRWGLLRAGRLPTGRDDSVTAASQSCCVRECYRGDIRRCSRRRTGWLQCRYEPDANRGQRRRCDCRDHGGARCARRAGSQPRSTRRRSHGRSSPWAIACTGIG